MARMREVYFADGPLISDLGIRISLELLPTTLAEELRQELVADMAAALRELVGRRGVEVA